MGVFAATTFYHFPLLCYRKSRDTSPPASPPAVKPFDTPSPQSHPSKLHQVLGSYPTLSPIAASLHYTDLINLLLASKHTYQSILSGGHELAVVFRWTRCSSNPQAVRVQCCDCGAVICRSHDAPAWTTRQEDVRAAIPTAPSPRARADSR